MDNKKAQEFERVLVTSALPYVNNVPHLGNLVCVISADVYTRFLRLLGKNVISVLGTDEHGTTTETKALEEGITPQECVDKYFAIHKDIYLWFNNDYDCLGRSSSMENHKITKDIFLKLKANGYIIKDIVEQVFCIKCEKFLADRFVEGTCPHCNYENARGDQCEKCGKLLNPEELIEVRCKVCGASPEIRETEHLFIDLPKLRPDLELWMWKKEKTWSENARTMTNAWLKEGLKPRCITRDLKWGIPVPDFPNKVFYSWFDAPIGYIGITAENKKDWHDWWHSSKKTKLVQFMGKDNIPFHTILFPSFLIGAKDDYTLMDSIDVNEYMNYESGKFSKSRGEGVFGDDAKESGIPADVWRYYIMINRPEKADTVFTWGDFQEKLNTELVGNLGNLINRTVVFLSKFYDSKIPKLKENSLSLKEEYDKIHESYENIQLKKALKQIMGVAKSGNQYFQEQEPWKHVKDNPEKAGNALAVLANFAKDLAILAQPFLPATADKIFDQLKLDKKFLKWENLGKDLLKQGHKIGQPEILFQKLEDKQVIEFKQRFAGKKKVEENKLELPFEILNLRVAEIKEVKDHPEADKLYIMKIDIGRPSQIVAGLRKHYTKDELLGKKIIVVSNLEPAKLRGQDSNGMLLAADDGKQVGLLFVEEAKPGDSATMEGVKPKSDQITIDEFFRVKLELKDGAVVSGDKELKAGSEKIRVMRDVKNGKVR